MNTHIEISISLLCLFRLKIRLLTYFYWFLKGCPKELSIRLKNESLNCHINKSGNYSVATSDRINGRSYWVSSDDKHAIWYENKSWRVGDIEDLGTGICGIYSVAPGNFFLST